MEEPDPDFGAMTVKQLKEFASANFIWFRREKTKAEYLETIRRE
jgi:hypothetical protein